MSSISNTHQFSLSYTWLACTEWVCHYFSLSQHLTCSTSGYAKELVFPTSLDFHHLLTTNSPSTALKCSNMPPFSCCLTATGCWAINRSSKTHGAMLMRRLIPCFLVTLLQMPPISVLHSHSSSWPFVQLSCLSSRKSLRPTFNNGASLCPRKTSQLTKTFPTSSMLLSSPKQMNSSRNRSTWEKTSDSSTTILTQFISLITLKCQTKASQVLLGIRSSRTQSTSYSSIILALISVKGRNWSKMALRIKVLNTTKNRKEWDASNQIWSLFSWTLLTFPTASFTNQTSISNLDGRQDWKTGCRSFIRGSMLSSTIQRKRIMIRNSDTRTRNLKKDTRISWQRFNWKRV